MVRVIMHGCNGVMGQVITGMAKDMEGLTIVAGIDLKNDKENGYPVYASLEECKEEADAVVDFASPKAADHLMDFCAEKKLGLVVYLDVSPETVYKRIGADVSSRPMLHSDEVPGRSRRLLNERRPLYLKAAHVAVDVNDRSLDAITEEIYREAHK